mmetsp:Transcript_6515/g.15762  ORF Transcript_6515/g.15762 Transcript_6515/m.15762 type:complete len:90 (-) Transcript_6515:524-793(-)
MCVSYVHVPSEIAHRTAPRYGQVESINSHTHGRKEARQACTTQLHPQSQSETRKREKRETHRQRYTEIEMDIHREGERERETDPAATRV